VNVQEDVLFFLKRRALIIEGNKSNNEK
jgi:hypothetical protein